jgi:hypothetical protein
MAKKNKARDVAGMGEESDDEVEVVEKHPEVKKTKPKEKGESQKAKVKAELEKVSVSLNGRIRPDPDAAYQMDDSLPVIGEDQYHINRIAKLKRTDQAKMGVLMLRVGYLKEAEDMDAMEDIDGEGGRADVEQRVQLRMGRWNARPINRAHVGDIQKQLTAGHNLSRKWPIWIAVNEGDIVNIQDIVDERQLATSDPIPVVQWREELQEVPVLGGQHRIHAARETLKALAKPLGEGMLAIEKLRKKSSKALKKHEKLNRRKDTDPEEVAAAADELTDVMNEVRQMEEKVKQLRERADAIRFWPAVVYNYGQWWSASIRTFGAHDITTEKLITPGKRAEREQLFRFLSENEKEKTRQKTTDEEILEGLWAIREAGGDKEEEKRVLGMFTSEKQEVKGILYDTFTRPALLKTISISPALRTCPILSGRFYATPKNVLGMEKITGRAPATDVSADVLGELTTRD